MHEVVDWGKLWYDEKWKSGRVVEGGRLESDWTEMSRRFESCLFRQATRLGIGRVFLFVKLNLGYGFGPLV